MVRTALADGREVTGDRQLDAIQTRLRRVEASVNARGAEPVTTDPVTFTAGGSQVIDHKLGRFPLEWSVSDVVDGYGGFQRITWTATTITIQSVFACTARFKVA